MRWSILLISRFICYSLNHSSPEVFSDGMLGLMLNATLYPFFFFTFSVCYCMSVCVCVCLTVVSRVQFDHEGELMGQEQSKGDDPLEEIQGLQVVRVLPHSPAHTSGLLPFFDIITAVDRTDLLDSENISEEFKALVAEREKQEVCFKVYNLCIRAYRDVFCVPSSSWGGGGMLGCSVEWCHAETCRNRSWRVLEVMPDTPVGQCGEIKAGRDHIIGMQRAEEPVITLLQGEDEFFSRVELWRSLQRAALEQLKRKSMISPSDATDTAKESNDIGKLLFLIYDSAANEIREVVVYLGSDVDAPLGMNLAAGLLHSLLTETPLVDEAGDSAMNHLPVMTFASHLGTSEQMGRYAPLRSPGAATNAIPDATEEAMESALQQPLPTASGSAIQPVVHSLLPIGMSMTENSRWRSPPTLTHSAEMGLGAAVDATASNGSGMIPALPLQRSVTNRPTIPAISPSLPSSAFKDVEHHLKSNMGPAGIPLRAEQPQSTEASHGSVHTSGSLARVAVSGVSLEGGKDIIQPPMNFPKLPPPLHFPIVKPTTSPH